MWDRIAKSTRLGAVLDAALHEAARQGAPRMGTDHLLLGLLGQPESLPARALGVTLAQARTALDSLDRAALAAIGLDLGRIESPDPPSRRMTLSRNGITSNAWAVLRCAVDATGVKTREQAPNHLLRSLLTLTTPDPSVELLTHLGIDRDTILVWLTELEQRYPAGKVD